MLQLAHRYLATVFKSEYVLYFKPICMIVFNSFDTF